MGAAGKFSLRKGFDVFHDVGPPAFSSLPHGSFGELSRTRSTACQLPSASPRNRFAALVLGPRGAGHITLLPRPLDASLSPAASVLILLVAAASSQVGSWRHPPPPPRASWAALGGPCPLVPLRRRPRVLPTPDSPGQLPWRLRALRVDKDSVWAELGPGFWEPRSGHTGGPCLWGDRD